MEAYRTRPSTPISEARESTVSDPTTESVRLPVVPNERVEQGYNALRSELIGTELSNPLLNFQYSKGSKGLQVVEEKADPIYERLVTKEKALTFDATRSGNDEFDPNLPLPVADEKQDGDLKKRHLDLRLQTTHAPQKLEYRLLNTERDARLYREERGANSLFLALGMLHWQDSIEGKSHRAPLLLVPVTLSRKGSGQKFEVRYNGQEIEENMALRRRLQDEFGIALPTLPSSDNLTPTEYFKAVERAIRGTPKAVQEKMAVSPDEMTVSLFSFSRYLMYRDLDPTNWGEGNRPTDHPIVKAVFDGGLASTPPSISNETRIDDVVNPRARYDVLNVDSSQLRALCEVADGKSLMIWGPPGTGKTLTIANMIANAVAQGKKVLFVSEKAVAERVEKNWLDTAGIGDLALELHSDATRKSVAAELRRTVELGEPVGNGRDHAVDSFVRAQQRLNKHVDTLRREVGESGFTGYEALSNLIALREQSKRLFPISDTSMQSWNHQDFDRALHYAEELESFCLQNGTPAQHLFYGVQLTPDGRLDRTKIAQHIGEAHRALARLVPELNRLQSQFELSTSLSEEQSDAAVQSLALIEDLYTDNGRLLSDIDLENSKWLERSGHIHAALELQLRYASEIESLRGAVNIEKLHFADLQEIEEVLRAYQGKWLLGRFFDNDYPRVMMSLRQITNVPESVEDQLKLVIELQGLKDRSERCRRQTVLWKELLGPHSECATIKGTENLGAWQRTAQLVYALQEFKALTDNHPDCSKLRGLLYQPKQVYQQKAAIHTLVDDLKTYKLNRGEAFKALRFSDGSAQEKFYSKSYASHETVFGKWRYGMDALDSIMAFNALSAEGRRQGLGFIADQSVNASDVSPNIVNSLKYSWFGGLAQSYTNGNPLAGDFSGEKHQQFLESFEHAHRDLLDANATEIARRHYNGMPKLDAGGESTILFKEIGKAGGHLPIRTLLSKAGQAVQAAKPIFMMSPHTVAQYLEPGAVDFDLVIFDETSQVRPGDALGAILRGSQLVICGDRKQLGPTTFFDSGSNFTYELDGEADEDVESILDLLRSAGMQEQPLTWHYRSRREGLISLANDEFYDGSLKVFPSTEAGSEAHGLLYHHVAHGVYDAGKSRVNRAEATAVAHAIIEHALRNPNESLGVVAMNRPQMEAITLELERLRRQTPEAEEFFTAHPKEPFFVKNLENVQGDERDRIFVSVGYGRDQDGRLSLNLGPITQKGGARRLNVLMTRAKLGCEVFTSLSPDEPELLKSESHAVGVLRKFLEHARDGGDSYLHDAATDLDPFQSRIKAALEQEGLTVHANVGPKGSGIDLAVVHPKDESRYILGIQLDGEAYQSVASARDRDLIKDEVLSLRGWHLDKSWILDWYRDPEGELKRLKKSIRRALKAERREEDEDEHTGRKVRQVARKPLDDRERGLAAPYRRAKLALGDLKEELKSGNRVRIKNWGEAITELVKREGPIHREDLRTRLRRCTGLSRTTTAFEEATDRGEHLALSQGAIRADGEFLYSSSNQRVFPRDRSKLRGAARSFSHIPPEEIDSALLGLVTNAFGIAEKELLHRCIELFGYKKTPDGADAIVADRLAELRNQHLIQQHGGKLLRDRG